MGQARFDQPSQDWRDLLPWYVNGTLDASEQRDVQAWLRREPGVAAELAACQQVRASVMSQLQLAPPPAVRARVMARIAARPVAAPAWLSWAWSASVAVAVLLVLWATVQPGIALQWVATQDSLASFRIYRAPVGSQNFVLVSQMPVQPGAQLYTFVDVLLVPWQVYVYRVDGVRQDGALAESRVIGGDALAVLPYHLVIVLTSLVAGYVAISLARQWHWLDRAAARQAV